MIATVPFAALGCGLVRGCPDIFRYAITVEMRPGFAIAPPAGTAFGYVRDGDYVDSLRSLPTFDPSASVTLAAGGMRAGVYDVWVQRDGFTAWVTKGVLVEDNGCYPETVGLDVTLHPAPSSPPLETRADDPQ